MTSSSTDQQFTIPPALPSILKGFARETLRAQVCCCPVSQVWRGGLEHLLLVCCIYHSVINSTVNCSHKTFTSLRHNTSQSYIAHHRCRLSLALLAMRPPIYKQTCYVCLYMSSPCWLHKFSRMTECMVLQSIFLMRTERMLLSYTDQA